MLGRGGLQLWLLLVGALPAVCTAAQRVSVVSSPNGRGDFAYSEAEGAGAGTRIKQKQTDCQGHPVLGSAGDRVGDGFCDEGLWGAHDFFCAKFSFDGGDCRDAVEEEEVEHDAFPPPPAAAANAAAAAAGTDASTKQPHAEPADSCAGTACAGQSTGSCWCEASCLAFGDCCEDFNAECADALVDARHARLLDADNPSCVGLCDDVDVEGNCYCTADCRGYGDCCPDFEDLCGNLTTAAATPAQTQRPVCQGCADCCGLDYVAQNEDGTSCSCNLLCRLFGDCCDDFFDECGSVTVEPITTCFDCDNQTCIGHERFVGDGICDNENATLNFDCEAWNYDGGDCADGGGVFTGSCESECGQLVSYFDARARRERRLFEAPESDSCEGLCGMYTTTCFCNNVCVEFDDCCDDFEELCNTRNPAPGGNWHELPEERHCWCDESCVDNADCCDDYLDECDSKEGMTASCLGACGEKRASGCWCDRLCEENNDCCDDYEAHCGCGTYFYQSCSGCTDERYACNYDPKATVDDGSCTYEVEGYNCEGECLARVDCAGVCGGPRFWDECNNCVLPEDRGNATDCLGVCDGSADYDGCGICGGNKAADECDCPKATDVRDCSGACNGVKTLNVCGICTSRAGRFAHIDCFGDCFGSGVEDECGVCNGDGSSCQDDYCEEGREADCAGVCDGTLVVDNCGVCGGKGSTRDCAGVCTGPLLEDQCGVCGGDGTTCLGCTDKGACNFWEHAKVDDGSCSYPASSTEDCFGNCAVGTDCLDECGGKAVVDECGVCNGFGATCTTPFCQGGKVDCWGECNGGVVKDECGICGGDSSLCQGCMDSTACNYNPSAKMPPPVYLSIRQNLDLNGCTFAPDPMYDCFGVCRVDVDCHGICGGPYVLDDCQVCGLNGGGGATCCAYDYDLFEGVDERRLREALVDASQAQALPSQPQGQSQSRSRQRSLFQQRRLDQDDSTPAQASDNPAPGLLGKAPAPHADVPAPKHPAPTVKSQSCSGYCGQQPPNADCWCDLECASYGDCCVDIVDACGVDGFPIPSPGAPVPSPAPAHVPSPGTHVVDPNHNNSLVPAPEEHLNPAPAPNGTHTDHPAPSGNHTGPSPHHVGVPAPSHVYSCEGQCLNTKPIHGPETWTGGHCFCDKTCTQFQDCCPDFMEFCAPACVGEFCPDGTVDCSGACDGTMEFDECKVCGGDGSTCTGGGDPWWCAEGFDCFGICGGYSVVDECGVCGGHGATCTFPEDTDDDGLLNGEPYCFTGARDCSGACDGDLEVDECFVCGGDSSTCVGCLKSAACNYDPEARLSGGDDACIYPPSDHTNCFGFCALDFDCLGECGGSAVEDECGVCRGEGASCRTPAGSDYCPNGDVDCFGACDGTAELDACGVCAGDSGTCTGCADSDACNFNALATISDTSCTYFEDASGTHYDNCLSKCDAGFDCQGTCAGNVTYDLCGVCGGEAFDVGCDGVCFSGKAADSCGVCGGFGTSCADDYCSGGHVADCFGKCGGTAVLDLCGVCNGFNKLRDCKGVCFGSTYKDACGVCGGDSSSCTGCGDFNACNFDINAVVSDDALCLYQVDFNYDCWGNCQVDIDCTGLCAGDNELDACGVCDGDSTTCAGCQDTTACNYDAAANVSDITQCYYETNQMSCTGVCKHSVDCGGNCNGYLTVDACGVCNGDSTTCVGCTNPAACNYNALATVDDDTCTYSELCAGRCSVDTDCTGECGGTLVVDECGVCAGFGASCYDGTYCETGTPDCRGECDGPREEDACGVCEGDTSTCVGCGDSDACNFLESATLSVPTLCTYPVTDDVDCFGNCVVGHDCKGRCGGTSVVDVCGVCGGFGASCTPDYCAGGRVDCAGECAGGRTIDACGVCGGSSDSCTRTDFCGYGIVDCFGDCHCPFPTSDPDTCARPVLDLPVADACSLFNDGSFEGLSSTKTTVEVTDLGAWDADGTAWVAVSKAVYWGGVAATDGGYFLVLEPGTLLNQSVHTTHWNFYLLEFDAAARPTDGMGVLEVTVDDTRVYQTIVPATGEMQSHSVLFQAESDLVSIAFFHSSSTAKQAVMLDKVRLTLSAQVLLDGGFEGLSTIAAYETSSYLGAWEGEGVLIRTLTSAWGGLKAPAGYYYFGEQGDGWLAQTLPTAAGVTYVLDFYAAARPGYGADTLLVYVDSDAVHELQLLDQDADGNVVGFARFQLNFRATRSQTELQFHHRVKAGDLTLFLDSVTVTPTADLALDGSVEGLSTTATSEVVVNPGNWRGTITIARSGDDAWGGILTPAGSYYAVLPAGRKATQTVPTQVGSSYEISFIVSCRPDVGMEEMYVIINGLTVYTLVVEDSVSWATHTLNFIADDTTAIISLYHGPTADGSTNASTYFDKFQVTPTADIVVDGGFEGISTTTEYEWTDDYLDMWTGSGVIIYTENEEFGGLAAPEGNYYVGRQGEGVIEQNLTTTPGQHYALTFHTTARPNFGADTLHVIVQGVRVYQMKLEDTGVFSKHTLNYQAQQALTLVTFQHVVGRDGNLTVLLDAIQAEPTEDIVVDGSFEGLALTTAHHNVSSDDNQTGAWIGGGVIVRTENAKYSKIKAPIGDYFFGLPSQASITQFLQTTIGKHYTVTFYAAPRPGYGAEPLTVHIRNEIVYVLELADDAAFEQHTLNFYANDTETEMTFSHEESDPDLSILLDDIRIAESDNLVIDGSFEGLSTTLTYEYRADGALGIWEDTGDNSQHVVVYSKNGPWGGLAAPVGDYYLSMQRDTTIAQTFHTTKGAFYVLSFYAASRPSVGMDTLEIHLDGVKAYDIVGADGVFEKMSYLFAAAGDEVTVAFVHDNTSGNDKAVFLDDIKLVEYDEAGADEDHILAC